MSTRVHELAKELNVKNQEILDFLKAEGENVKESHLASLEPHQIEKVRQRYVSDRPASSPPPPVPPAQNSPVVVERTEPPKPTTEDRNLTTVAEPKAREEFPVTAPKDKRETPAVVPPRTFATPSEPAKAHQPPVADQAARPSAQTPSFVTPPAPSAPAQGAAPVRTMPPPAPSRISGTAPTGRGPILSKGIHRHGQPPVSLKPGEPANAPAEPRPQPPQAPAAQKSSDPQQATPFTRRDYIDPYGVRRPLPSSGAAGGGDRDRPVATDRRPGGEPSQERRNPQRPAGQVTPSFRQYSPTQTPAGQGPIRRTTDQRPAPPRPSGPGTPPQGGSYTRPDRKYTPEELREMMQNGQIGRQSSTMTKPGSPGTLRPPLGAIRAGTAPVAAIGAGPAPVKEVDEEEEKRRAKAGLTGDRAQRRTEREKRQKDRVKSPQPVDSVIDGADDVDERGYRRRPSKSKSRSNSAPQRKEHAQIEPPISIRSLSEAIGVKANELMTFLFRQGKPVRINDALTESMAVELAIEFGVDLQVVHQRTAEDDLLEAFTDEMEEGEKTPRAPIITILGHVDHGKTSLLDRIRKSDVAAHESGGITQHIGAYQVAHNGQAITFLDTPGHEAFTSMRARGANVTDIVVLVVAADDGVMPQTEEAISHAKAAEVPIIVALNKVDLPNVNFNRIYGELSQHGLVPEEYGGDTIVVKTSAHTGQGIPELLENLLLLAELKELKSNPDRPAVGTCLEAQISEGRGVVATMLVQDGTLRIGDIVVCGDGYGRVRSMFNHRGEPLEVAGPNTPVEVSGLDSVPEAGEKFAVLSDLSMAREISETRKMRSREQDRSERSAVTLENLFDRMNEQRVRSLNIILKADVQGSLEALTKELDKLENTEIPIRILHRAVGGISESDVQLADASQAIIVGFRVAPEDRAITLADEKKIDIRRYDIIYQVTDEIKKAIEGMLVPEIKEVHLGRASVRQVFKITKIGTVAGCFVTQGTIERSAKVRLLRDGREIYKGSIEALKRFKDDVKEVREGFECGIRVSNYDDLKTDDIIEAYKIEEIRRTL